MSEISKISIYSFVFISGLLTMGCGEKSDLNEYFNSDDLPFSFGGAQVGIHKESLRKILPFQNCEQATQSRVVCKYYGSSDRGIKFFSGTPGLVSLGFVDPYDHLSYIAFFSEGSHLSQETISASWKNSLRCASGSQIKSQSYANGLIGKMASELRMSYDFSTVDFFCVTQDQRIIKVGEKIGRNKSQHVEIFQVNRSLFNVIDRVLEEIENSKNRQQELKKF